MSNIRWSQLLIVLRRRKDTSKSDQWNSAMSTIFNDVDLNQNNAAEWLFLFFVVGEKFCTIQRACERERWVFGADAERGSLGELLRTGEPLNDRELYLDFRLK